MNPSSNWTRTCPPLSFVWFELTVLWKEISKRSVQILPQKWIYHSKWHSREAELLMEALFWQRNFQFCTPLVKWKGLANSVLVFSLEDQRSWWLKFELEPWIPTKLSLSRDMPPGFLVNWIGKFRRVCGTQLQFQQTLSFVMPVWNSHLTTMPTIYGLTFWVAWVENTGKLPSVTEALGILVVSCPKIHVAQSNSTKGGKWRSWSWRVDFDPPYTLSWLSNLRKFLIFLQSVTSAIEKAWRPLAKPVLESFRRQVTLQLPNCNRATSVQMSKFSSWLDRLVTSQRESISDRTYTRRMLSMVERARVVKK